MTHFYLTHNVNTGHVWLIWIKLRLVPSRGRYLTFSVMQRRNEWLSVSCGLKRQGSDTRSSLGAAVSSQSLPDSRWWMVGALTLRILTLRRAQIPIGAGDWRTIGSGLGFPLTGRTAATWKKTFDHHLGDDWQKKSVWWAYWELWENYRLITTQHIIVLYI